MSLTVRAQVVDINKDEPKSADRFLVDTNAWYWLFYSRASQAVSTPKSYQLSDYPSYINKAISASSLLHCFALSFAELAHNIEKAEREIYGSQSNRNIHTKEFRNNCITQRRKVVTHIIDTWDDVKSISTLLDMKLDTSFMQTALSLFPSVSLDGYDLFMAETALQTEVTQIITDDSDYATVPGLTIFTSNRNIIQAANSAKKLITRSS